jgi:NTE family protein
MKFLISLALLFMFSCQHTQNKSISEKAILKTAETKNSESVPDVKISQETTPQVVPVGSHKAVPNFGIIFSGGGAKTWAHVGVLKEMQKYKFPIVSVAGIEWGAVVGAIYAQNLSSNEVEWEMSKFKSLDKSDEFIQTIFVKKSVADMKASFLCPSINLKSQTVYLLNRGNVNQFLPFCVPSPGLVRPYGQSAALMSDLSVVIQQLKLTGVQKIILINVLSSKNTKPFVKSLESVENQVWVMAATQLAKKNIGVDEVIEIDISDVGIDGFDQRRETMAKGSELSYNQIKKIADKYGL